MIPLQKTPDCVIELSMRNAIEDGPARLRLLDTVRSHFIGQLDADPKATSLRLSNSFGTVSGRLVAGKYHSGGNVQFTFREGTSSLSRKAGTPGNEAALPTVSFPSPDVQSRARDLVGLEDIVDDVVTRALLMWGEIDHDPKLSSIAEYCPAYERYLQQSAAIFVFAGDSGCGKSVTALTICDVLCRKLGISGTAIKMVCGRGDGTVGSLSSVVQSGFRQFRSLPSNELRCAIFDESDSLLETRRSSSNHKEDRAAVSNMLTEFDESLGARSLIILTSNMVDMLDPAVIRRAVVYTFPRPNHESRRKLLAAWLPKMSARDVEMAARASQGMTPADIESTLAEYFLRLARASRAPIPRDITAKLRSGRRTKAV